MDKDILNKFVEFAKSFIDLSEDEFDSHFPNDGEKKYSAILEEIGIFNNTKGDTMCKEKIINVPTGEIVIIKGSRGLLELVSLGDYGKNANIKADFLGITRELKGVPNGDVQPLSKKWVITLSTQYGCNSNCVFCDVPKVGCGINATKFDLSNQLETALSLHREVNHTERLNIHYARMGEPSWNRNVILHALNLRYEIEAFLGDSLIHPVVSTMLPNKNKNLKSFIMDWANVVKNECFNGDAGLQFSINSTCDKQRNEMFSNNSLSLEEISKIGIELPNPKGRKYSLNFALADDYKLDAEKLSALFNPNKFMVKITPLHITKSCKDNDIKTSNGYSDYVPYKKVESDLKKYGFDVLVFIPSSDEDDSRITCGNAILSGTKPNCEYSEKEL